jgi:hypothetical protein
MEKAPSTFSARHKRVIWAIVLGLPAVLLAFTGLAVAVPMAADFTPTAFVYLPFVIRMPTPTPTPVQPPAPPGGSTSVSGSLTLDDQTPGKTYATWCEDVWFHEVFHNDDGARSMNWTILGVTVKGPGTDLFHTSWSNQTSFFTDYPNCFGPGSMPCGSTSGAGAWRDAVGGYRPDSQLFNPGTYTLTEAVCLSSFNDCLNSVGWHTLSSVQFVEVDLISPTCNRTTKYRTTSVASTDPLAGCHLDLSDPQNVRMVCPGK